MKAVLRQTRITPKKVSLIASLIRGKKATDALDILRFTRKRTSPVMQKLLESAISNATNNLKQNREDLYIKEILVSKGPTYKRGIPISRGRTHPILKRTSHVILTLEVKATMAPKAKTKPATEDKSPTETPKVKTVKTKKTATK
mgnify:CR=1 FL=1